MKLNRGLKFNRGLKLRWKYSGRKSGPNREILKIFAKIKLYSFVHHGAPCKKCRKRLKSSTNQNPWNESYLTLWPIIQNGLNMKMKKKEMYRNHRKQSFILFYKRKRYESLQLSNYKYAQLFDEKWTFSLHLIRLNVNRWQNQLISASNFD